MSDPTTNAQRARDFVDDLPIKHCWCSAAGGRLVVRCHTCEAVAESIERLLNESEDRGARQPAGPDTVEALHRLIRETLEHAVGPLVAAERAAAVSQVIIANFHLRLMDEADEVAP